MQECKQEATKVSSLVKMPEYLPHVLSPNKILNQTVTINRYLHNTYLQPTASESLYEKQAL